MAVAPDAGKRASIEHLRRRLAILEARVTLAVERRRQHAPKMDDPLRGLYLSDEDVDELLANSAPPGATPEDEQVLARALDELEAEAAAAERAGSEVRLAGLGRRFSLEPAELDLLVVAMAPDLDARFERLYGYLNDDVTRRRPTVGLALELASLSAFEADHRAMLAAGGRLASAGLVVVEEPERPFLTRLVSVPDRVTAYCLGGDGHDTELAGLVLADDELAAGWTGDADSLARLLASGQRLAYVHEHRGGGGAGLAAEALRRAGMHVFGIDLRRLAAAQDPDRLARVAAREARMLGAGLVAGPIDSHTAGPATGAAPGAGDAPPGVRALADGDATVVLVGSLPFDPGWSRHVAAVVEAPPALPSERMAEWSVAFGDDVAAEVDAATVTAHLQLSPVQVHRSARAARLEALGRDGTLGVDAIRAGARRQNAAGLERVARRIEPEARWDDLVLRPHVLTELRHVAARARHREQVLGEWRMRPGGGRRQGVSVLFAGDSGTGKTMSGEVIAGDLGLDLYAVNLATVVDKYIGETEKNLERIFNEIAGVNGVLLFDEADALFGRRSEVRDSHDRYANVETAYLLQRLESFDGLAILTTNLRKNIDEAFSRRLDALVEFPRPDARERLALWEHCLGPVLPRSGELDLGFMAESFDLAGGSIRAIAITAAYQTAELDEPLSMATLVRATASEYRKLGRLCLEQEFGPWYEVAAAAS